MNIHTPIPVYFCNHKGVRSNPVVKQHNIQLYPASTLKKDMPNGLCVSSRHKCITYRFCWTPKQKHWSNHYFEISTCPNEMVFYNGRSDNYNMHRQFMQTFEIVKPIADQVFLETHYFGCAA